VIKAWEKGEITYEFALISIIDNVNQIYQLEGDRQYKAKSLRLSDQVPVKAKGRVKKQKGKKQRAIETTNDMESLQELFSKKMKLSDTAGDAAKIMIPEWNRGYRALLKLGWTPGQSLGAKDTEGILEPIKFKFRSPEDMGGIGFKRKLTRKRDSRKGTEKERRRAMIGQFSL
jgi:hypothetical protein